MKINFSASPRLEFLRVHFQVRGQKLHYWYVVVSAIQSVLTFMATAIGENQALKRYIEY